MDNLALFELFSKEIHNVKLPAILSPAPQRRTKSISKTSDSKFILSNSIDETFTLRLNKSPNFQHKRMFDFNKVLPVELELRKAIRSIISHKPKVKRLINRKHTTNLGIYTMKNYEESDVSNFIKAMFSHEPSQFRRVGLTAEPKAMDLRAAEKILQDAKKIIKHGVMKKSNQQEHKTLVENFWKQNISKEEFVRWDVFEEGLLAFFENFMVCNCGVIRKVNWKELFQKMFERFGNQSESFEMWPKGKGKRDGGVYTVVGFFNFAGFVGDGSLHKAIIGCIEDLPFYIENLRKGSTYKYACGCYYKGEWKDGKREGNGTLELCSGESFFGNFISGLRQEFGTFKGKGYYYKGDFKKDKFHGYGVLKFPDNSYFDGIWVKSQFFKGKFDFGNGDIYEGEWFNNEFEGRGKLTLSDGTIKKGIWRNSKLCGDGYIRNPCGTIQKGFFLDDVIQSDDQRQ